MVEWIKITPNIKWRYKLDILLWDGKFCYKGKIDPLSNDFNFDYWGPELKKYCSVNELSTHFTHYAIINLPTE